MPRANSSVPRHRRHKKILKMAKGYWGARSRLYRTAKEAVERGWLYAYRDRRRKKRDFRRLWITRINAAVRQYDMSYSVFIHKLQENNIKLNRKQLSEMAIREPQSFKKLVESLK
ncbi:MAG: large subunit ribosomal protein [Candidatus Marinimicrobia bacterium]|jgi:large subunit ribosomal protein L20|uniref:50S ribosomal protein L20 n=1 Tax=Fidelibacter multiformis TaxID=3377529 RepID=UPI0029E3CC7E|nr:large subunit ribosomal protein [Candidatus Neomarinimicrobiota bacterium]